MPPRKKRRTTRQVKIDAYNKAVRAYQAADGHKKDIARFDAMKALSDLVGLRGKRATKIWYRRPKKGQGKKVSPALGGEAHVQRKQHLLRAIDGNIKAYKAASSNQKEVEHLSKALGNVELLLNHHLQGFSARPLRGLPAHLRRKKQTAAKAKKRTTAAKSKKKTTAAKSKKKTTKKTKKPMKAKTSTRKVAKKTRKVKKKSPVARSAKPKTGRGKRKLLSKKRKQLT